MEACSLKQRVVVCGPPGSGKTTYVNEHRKPGDFVWDFDVMREAVFGSSGLVPTETERQLLVAMLKAAVPLLKKWTRAWVIVTKRGWAAEIGNTINAQVVVLNTPREECVRRVKAREWQLESTRQASIAAIGEW